MKRLREGRGLRVVAPPGGDLDTVLAALEADTGLRAERSRGGATFEGDDVELWVLGPRVETRVALIDATTDDDTTGDTTGDAIVGDTTTGVPSDELVTSLDGLPFAIEVASKVGRMVGMPTSVRELLDVEHRGTTLRRLVDERWCLASPEARLAALRLATWLGALSFELARNVTRSEERTTTLLELVELGLIHRESTGLLRMLQPVRAVLFERARDVLSADDDVFEALRGGAVMLDLRGASWSQVRERVEWRMSLDRPDDALALLLAVEPSFRGPEHADALHALVARSHSTSPFQARALLLVGRSLYRRGRHDEAKAVLQRARSLVTSETSVASHADHSLATRIEGQLSLVARARGDWEAAERLALSSVEHANIAGDPGLEADALLRLADVVAALGHVDQGLEHRLLAVTLARRSDDREIRARVVGALAIDYLQRGDIDAFERLVPEALREVDALGAAVLETNVAIAAALRDRFVDAERSFLRALQAFREIEHPASEAMVQLNRGWMRLVAEWPDALACFEEGLIAANHADNQSLRTSATVGLVVALARLGRLDEALVERAQAASDFESTDQADVLAVQLACLDVLHARALTERESEAAANELLARARRALEAASVTRVLEHPARRLLERWLAEERGTDELPVLQVSSEMEWFFLREVGWVDLRRRRALRAILGRLVEAATSGQSDGVPTSEITSSGWPGERIVAHAAASRVYVAVRTLRQLGLGAHLETTRVGYRLDPALRVLTGVMPPTSSEPR